MLILVLNESFLYIKSHPLCSSRVIALCPQVPGLGLQDLGPSLFVTQPLLALSLLSASTTSLFPGSLLISTCSFLVPLPAPGL